MHLPRCPVEGKLCFPSEEAAAEEIFECRMLLMFHNRKRRKETRSYPCDHCGAFHLTAMTDPPKHVSEGSRDGVQMTQDGKNKKNVRRPLRPATSAPVRRSEDSGGAFPPLTDWSAPVSDSAPSYCASDVSSTSSSTSDFSSSCGSGGGGE